MSYHDCGEFCWDHGPLPDISDLGDAVILNTVPLNVGGAFMLINSFELTNPAPKRRLNREVDDRQGSIGRRSRRIEREVDLEIRVVGYVDEAGNPYSDIIEGVERNISYLQLMTIDAVEDEFGQIPIEVHRKSGIILTGFVQVDDFVAGKGRGDRTVMMNVGIPAGSLTEEI